MGLSSSRGGHRDVIEVPLESQIPEHDQRSLMTSTSLPLAPEAATSLSLTAGGPSFRLERRLGLEVPVWRRIAVFLALTWGVVVGLAIVDLLLRPGVSLPALSKLGAHTRLLVGIPLLVVAERLLERRVAHATRRLVSRRVLAEESLEAWRRVVSRIERWRDTPTFEIVLAAFVLGVTAAGLAHVVPSGFLRWFAPTLHAQPGPEVMRSASLWWFLLVSQPLFWFLLLRWLWHWSLWTFALARLSRLKLHLQASHPDRAGGIGFLQEILDAVAPVVLCVAATLVATFADEIEATGARAATFSPYLLGVVALSLLVGLAPFAVLTPSLFRAKRKGQVAYSWLARGYIEDFEEKWVKRAPTEGALGTPDLQSLADLGNSFEVIDQMRLTVFSRQAALRLLLVAALPALPLVLSRVPATELVRRLLELAL